MAKGGPAKMAPTAVASNKQRVTRYSTERPRLAHRLLGRWLRDADRTGAARKRHAQRQWTELVCRSGGSLRGYAAYRRTLEGETGQRNGLRSDGQFSVDSALCKRFTMPYNEHHTVQVRGEAFNTTNTARFACVNPSRGNPT